MPFCVVLTGGIASGKTAIANEFIALGIPVIDTDQLSRDVVEPGTPALKQIVAEFGPGILDGNKLNRSRLRSLVFDNPAARKKLEAIQWPAIRAELASRSAAAVGPYQIHAIPLYVESGRKGAYDRVLVVDCPEEIQLERLVRRDKIGVADAQKILAVQASRKDRLAAANDVIVNDGNFDVLREQVRRLHESYLKFAAEKAR